MFETCYLSRQFTLSALIHPSLLCSENAHEEHVSEDDGSEEPDPNARILTSRRDKSKQKQSAPLTERKIGKKEQRKLRQIANEKGLKAQREQVVSDSSGMALFGRKLTSIFRPLDEKPSLFCEHRSNLDSVEMSVLSDCILF